VVIDADLMAFARVNFHPLVNSMTTTIGREDFFAFLRATGHEARVMHLPEPAAGTRADPAHAETALGLK
jgi:Ala-tRNA(Pro) deacylase